MGACGHGSSCADCTLAWPGQMPWVVVSAISKPASLYAHLQSDDDLPNTFRMHRDGLSAPRSDLMGATRYICNRELLIRQSSG